MAGLVLQGTLGRARAGRGGDTAAWRASLNGAALRSRLSGRLGGLDHALGEGPSAVPARRVVHPQLAPEAPQ